MNFQLYDYVSTNGNNVFKAWISGLQSKERAKLNEKIDKLAQFGDDLYPHMLSGTHVAGINKLRVRGSVQLRPLLCNGPVRVDTEYTLLMGAKEVDGKWSPKKAPETADLRKQEVISNPNKRRMKHE